MKFFLATSFALLSMLTGVESNGLARLQNKLQHEVSVEGATDAKEFPYHQDDAHGGSFEDAVKSLIKSKSGTFVAEKFGRLHDVAYYDTTVENGFKPRKVFDKKGDVEPGQESPAKLTKDFGYGHEVKSACVALNKLGSDLSDANLKDIVAGLVLLAGTIHSMEGHTQDLKLMLTGLMGQGDYKAYGPCMVGEDSFFAAGPESIVGKIRGALKGLHGDLWDQKKGTVKDNADKNTMADYMSAGDKADFYGYRDGGDDGLCLGANMFGEAMMYGGACRGLKAPKWCTVKFSDPFADNWQAYWGDGQDKFYNYVLKKHGYGNTVMADSAKMKRCTKLSTCEYLTNRCKFEKHAWVKK